MSHRSSLVHALRPLRLNGAVRAVARVAIPERYRQRLTTWFRNTSPAFSGPRVQWCRVIMNEEIRKFISGLDCSNMDVLEISGGGTPRPYDFRSYRVSSFPDYDVCRGPLEVNTFDLVIAEQVLEHVLRPDLAVENIFKMLRSGGKFVVSTPFLLKVHGHPGDLYRWTEQGMTQLLSTAGFRVVCTGAWGNRECMFADMTDGMAWTDYIPSIHTLRNEAQFPIVIWAFAEKRDPSRADD